MTNTKNTLLAEVMGKDIDTIRSEMAKRADYVRNVTNPKNAGNTEYQKLGDYTLIRMFYPLPADFLEILGEQFALGSENDSYEFRLNESYRKDFDRYLEMLRSECEADGLTFIPVIYAEVSKKRYSFPCSLRGIVSMNVAKRDYKLYAECMMAMCSAAPLSDAVSAVSAPSADVPAPSAAVSAPSTAVSVSSADATVPSEAAAVPTTASQDENMDLRLFLCEAEHEERKDLIQRPMIEGEKGALSEMDSLMKWQTFAVTPFLAAAFLTATVFSWQMQSTGESGIGQTIFLGGMGIGLLIFTIYNTVIRVRRTKRYNEAVRENNQKRKDAYEAALAAEKERYLDEKEKLHL